MSNIWGAPARPSAPSRRAFLPSPVFLLIVAVFAASGTALWIGQAAKFAVFGFVLSGWLMSLCLHEYAHALVAYLGGDHTVAEKGYLTLDPLKYSNPLLSFGIPLVFVLLGGIGLPGGAVLIEHHRLRGRAWESAVSAAGPMVNVLFAVVSVSGVGAAASAGLGHPDFWAGLAFLSFLQVTAAILNLLPVPGLDGFGIIQPWLPRSALEAAAKVARFGVLIVFFVLLWIPQVNAVFFRVVFTIVSALGGDPGLAMQGYGLFRFWT
ncbi:MAG: peptidase [Actinomycetia bacterium]|jgi:Zn-dependent protease|nr:peptidase [Actinomycetes bacterium]